MYTVTHLEKYATKPPFPEPVPRPGEQQAAAPAASRYDTADVPAIPLEQLGQWLSA
jgi:hypothetical protein